jgi:hypothetical protein
VLRRLNFFQKIFIVLIFVVFFIFNFITSNKICDKKITVIDLINVFLVTFIITIFLLLIFSKIKNTHFVIFIESFFYFMGLIFIVLSLSEILTVFLKGSDISLSNFSNLMTGIGVLGASFFVEKFINKRIK